MLKRAGSWGSRRIGKRRRYGREITNRGGQRLNYPPVVPTRKVDIPRAICPRTSGYTSRTCSGGHAVRSIASEY